jgi:hypothetical protein
MFHLAEHRCVQLDHMTYRIIGNQKERAFEWAKNRFPGSNPPYWHYYTALFVENDVGILGAVFYSDFTSNSVDMHVAAMDDRNWLSKPFLSMVFGYPFIQLGLGRVTARIGADNHKAERFLHHLGFTHEGTHPEGWEKGVALLSFGLLKEQCRYLRAPFNGKAESTRRPGSASDSSGANLVQHCDGQ